MAPTFSVVLLTHNRVRMLGYCLQSLVMQKRLPDEIVIVDNGSTDNTKIAIERFRKENAGGIARIITVDGNPRGGWAAARNQGVRAASCEWVAFTDDDCEPNCEWLAIAEELASQGYDAIGGMAIPPPYFTKPAWWHPKMAWAVGLSVPAAPNEQAEASPWRYPTTANLAVRRSILLSEPFQEIDNANLHHGSLPSTQRRKMYQSGREDAQLWRRLRRGGYRCVFDFRLRVLHHISPSRLKWHRLLRRAHHDGIALQRREPHKEYLMLALDTLLCFPIELLGKIWFTSKSPLQEAAWRYVWATRQAGQVREYINTKGWIPGTIEVLFLTTKLFLAKQKGLLKHIARKIGVSLRKTIRKKGGKQLHSQKHSIAIAAAGFIGDMVVLHPFITTLKAQHPETTITLITNRWGESLYRDEPAIKDIVVVGDPCATPREDDEAIIDILEERKPQWILIPYFHDVSPRGLFPQNNTKVITFDKEVGFPRRWWYDCANKCVHKQEGHPEAEHLLRLFKYAGLSTPLLYSPIPFSPEETDVVQKWLDTENLPHEDYILIAPGAGKTEKRWKESRWAEVLQHICDVYRSPVILIGSPAEKALCAHIRDLSGREAHIFCRHDIREMAILIGSARLLLCCDSGHKHLAVSLNTPSLALFGPTDERQWGAIRDAHLHSVVRGCAWDLTYEERVGLGQNHQMFCIKTESVLRALDKILSVNNNG